MSKEYACRAVDRTFAQNAPAKFTNSVDLTITPEQLWEVLVDADAWPKWVGIIKKATWTSEPPHGVGTTRTVDMLGGIVGNEAFLAWEPGVAMAFRFNSISTSGIDAFAEDYKIERTATGCRLTWILAMEPAGVQIYAIKIFGPVMNFTFARFLKNLRRYTDERFAVAQRPAS